MVRSFIRPIGLFIIGFGLVVAALLWWLQEGTRVGAMVRASVDDEEVARALGINVSLLFTLVFALGAFLAALGGVMGGPIVGVYPGADFEVLLLGFVVVIIGGLGSLKGALVGGLIVGLLDNFGKVFFPEFALFTIFAPMALILARAARRPVRARMSIVLCTYEHAGRGLLRGVGCRRARASGTCPYYFRPTILGLLSR